MATDVSQSSTSSVPASDDFEPEPRREQGVSGTAEQSRRGGEPVGPRREEREDQRPRQNGEHYQGGRIIPESRGAGEQRERELRQRIQVSRGESGAGDQDGQGMHTGELGLEQEQIKRRIDECWNLYFPFDNFTPDSPWFNAAKLFRAFLNGSLRERLGDGTHLLVNIDLERATEIVFDYRSWCDSVCPDGELAEFSTVLRENASITLKCIGLALCSMRRQRPVHDGLAPLSNRITPRFVRFYPQISIRDIKSNMLGKFVSIRGTVVRVSGLQPLVKRMDFSCNKCGEIITKNMLDGRFQSPTHCERRGCKGKSFISMKPSAVSVDYQKVRLQELDESGGSLGSVPRSIDVELSEELVESLKPGDNTSITGVVKALSSESLAGRGKRAKGKNKETSLLVLVIEANVVEEKSVTSEDLEVNGDSHETPNLDLVEDVDNVIKDAKGVFQYIGLPPEITNTITRVGHPLTRHEALPILSEDDFRMISTVASKYDFAYLVHSLCPLIMGHNTVKASLLLGLAGGTRNWSTSRDSVSIRSDIHVLIVGDPGMGKSQMLKASAAVSPRGVFVCGNTTTKSGLTVSMSKDQADGFTLEAGALVLADRGACCIDELDKIACDHAALLEAMEQQSISIAKAGTCCTLAARTTILAAANPIGGHYNRNKTVLENLNMSAPLLSRFDLIILLVDSPNSVNDDGVADFVMDMHINVNTRKLKRRKADGVHSNAGEGFQTASHNHDDSVDRSFSKYLRQRLQEYSEVEPLPPAMLRKYLGFANHYCHPKLTPEACKVLQAFYLKLRSESREDTTPITTRQLESLIRLSQARAKLELRTHVTKEDAQDIVSLMRGSLVDTLTDNAGVVDIGRSRGMSMPKMCKALVSQLKRTARERNDPNFTVEQLKHEAQKAKILHLVEDFRDLIEILNQQCFLLKKGPQQYRLPGNDFM